MLPINFLKNPSQLLSAVSLTLLVSGCYNGARVQNMEVGPQANADFGKYSHNVILEEARNDTRWTSRASDKNFEKALENSLYSNDIANDDDPQYQLSADIVKLTPPSMGFDMYVTTDIQYVVRNINTDKIVIDKTIESRASSTEKEEAMLTDRKRLVDERAINKNIEDFLTYLRR